MIKMQVFAEVFLTKNIMKRGIAMKDVLSTITELRLDRGWSEYQLAEKSGLPQSTISSWYRKRMVPSTQSLEKISAAFGITLSQLLAEEGEAVILTEEQRVLLERWTRLTDEQRNAMLKLMEVI